MVWLWSHASRCSCFYLWRYSVGLWKTSITIIGCETFVDSLTSIVALEMFTTLDTSLILVLLRMFVKPMRQNADFQNVLKAASTKKIASRTRNVVRRYEVSCYITTMSTISINVLYVFTNYYTEVEFMYDFMSFVDCILHAITTLYTYRNWDSIYHQLVCAICCFRSRNQVEFTLKPRNFATQQTRNSKISTPS